MPAHSPASTAIPALHSPSSVPSSTSTSDHENHTVPRPTRTGTFVGLHAEWTPGHGHKLIKLPSALHLLVTSRMRTLAREKTLSTVPGAAHASSADAEVPVLPRRAETIAAAGVLPPLENEEEQEEPEKEDFGVEESSPVEPVVDNTDEDVPPLDLA
ncbi:hypothetical protein TRAPUB_9662 [Trametes pubescens]|uniref:Uncharacterized protein n=1 Tax=Trametes pubescens TaxID=154538 RepID=A0A1M2W1R1_TRAPU|nr:hypothetical protein TRAPUB_9662 [Trametes pubescens]